MDKESSRGIGMRLLAPRLNNRNLIFSAPPNQHWPRPRPLLENQPWEVHCRVTLLRSSPILKTAADYTYTHIHTKTITDTNTYTHSFTSPPPIPRLRRFEPPAWQAGLWLAPGNGCMSGWLIARAGLLPLLQSHVSMVYYVLLLLRCFSCSHTVLPKEHSLGVIFFLLAFLLFAVFFFNSLSSCPVYPIVIYVCCVWTGWWLISLVLETSDNKVLLLLLMFNHDFFSTDSTWQPYILMRMLGVPKPQRQLGSHNLRWFSQNTRKDNALQSQWKWL